MNDEAFEALANGDRRDLLLDLLESNPQDGPGRVTDGVAGDESADRRADPSMYHNHLPRLEAYGYVRWDRENGEVVRGPEFETIRPLLEFLDGRTDS